MFLCCYTSRMHDKITTIEELAIMVKHGFDQTATKKDLELFKDGLQGVKEVMTLMQEEINETRKDVIYIRSTMNALISNDTTQDAAIINLAERVEILEEAALVPA